MKTIKVANGFVEGTVKTVLGKEVVEFLCIPYCKPPVNELRFQKPQPCETFLDNVINKLTFETCPPQSSVLSHNVKEVQEAWMPKEIQDENSLYVNVWCPLNILNEKKTVPVFVYIYGGAFVSGSSSIPLYDGSLLATQENIIVVSFNYRLGMLGFLYLDDPLAVGNLGIYDQVLALQWIHKNILAFKGNPDNITLGGTSAGGCSTSLHLIIKESWPCFNKAMIHSGSCLSDWGLLRKEEIVRSSVTGVNNILNKFHFPLKWNAQLSSHEKEEIMKFLQSLDFKEFLIDTDLVDGFLQFAWAPCVDGKLITDHPRRLLNNGQFKVCPTIFLNANNEVSLFINWNFPEIEINESKMIDIKYFDECFPYYPRYPKSCSDLIKAKIKTEYNLHEELPISLLDKIISDQKFVSCTMEFANIISQSNSQVYYLWLKTLSLGIFWPKWCGVVHGEDIFYLFGILLRLEATRSNSEKENIIEFMRQCGKFIREGHLRDGLPYYNETTKSRIIIDGVNWTADNFSDDQFSKAAFWNNLRKEHD